MVPAQRNAQICPEENLCRGPARPPFLSLASALLKQADRGRTAHWAGEPPACSLQCHGCWPLPIPQIGGP